MIQTFKLFFCQACKICVGLKMMLALPFLLTHSCLFFPGDLIRKLFEEEKNLVFSTSVNDETSAQLKQLKGKAINLR